MAGRRRLLLFGLLALTLAATAWVSRSEFGESVEVVASVSDKPQRTRGSPSGERAQKSEALALGKLERTTTLSVGDLNPFGAKSWFVPPPPPPPAPPPVPTAPPLPFNYQGKFEEDAGKWIIYLVKGDQFYAVKKGDTFDTHYRIEGIENGNLVIEYLPLAVKQTIPIGSES